MDESFNLLVLGSGPSGKNSRLTGRKAPGVLGAEEDPVGDELDGDDRVGDFRLSEWPLDAPEELLVRELPLLLPWEFPLLLVLEIPLLLFVLELLFNRDDTGYWSVLVSSSCNWPRCCVSLEIGVSGGL